MIEATVKTFLDDRFALEPVAATVMGNHSHDHRLGDFSAAGFAARDALTEDWLRRFTSMGEDSLDPYQKVDRDLVLAELRGEHALQSFERWRRQPSLYSDAITRGAYYTLLRGYSTVEDRLAMLAERLAEAPAALDAARENLDAARVPPEWIAIAERTAPAGAAFLRDELPRQIPNTSHGRAIGLALLPATRAAADALDRYVAWLRADLLPRAKGTFAIGRETFEALLREKELVDHDASSLRAYGEELFRETESKIAEAARALGDDDWRDSVARLRRDHPEADQLVETYRAEMERSRAAVVLSSIASIPYGEDLTDEAMPDFQRTTYPYAAYVAAAPFEANRRGRFWVTLPMADDDERTRRERLEGHPRAGIPVIACHEGYPGHHLQLTYAADNASLARKALRSNLMVEGWGLYVEELMTEIGFLDSPETRLLRLKDLLWRAARVVVDVGLSTGEMSFDEAVAYMVERPRLEPPNAIAEVRRYTLTPTQPSSYALGREAILGLRDRARAKGWGMRFFHDKLLGAGSLPPKLLARDVDLG
ncbi:MAG: DUF885 domain-containing protein [Chloroflexota bacterium]